MIHIRSIRRAPASTKRADVRVRSKRAAALHQQLRHELEEERIDRNRADRTYRHRAESERFRMTGEFNT